MKWLILNTLGNPGDSFARYGIERLITQVDPKAQFDLLNKEEPTEFAKRNFDRAVYCGTPLFWSHPGQTCSEIWWWSEIFRQWPTADPRKFICLGVGDYIGPLGVHNPTLYEAAIEEALEKSFAVTTRNHIHDDPRLIDSVCPSLFAFEQEPANGELLLCNLMEEGGHEPHMAPEEAAAWKEALPMVAEDLIRKGFEFAAHSDAELDLAERIEFPVVHRFSDHRDYLDLYRKCSVYVGNRLHGAMVAALAGARVTAIGYDSRVKMLAKVGIHAHTPREYLRDIWPIGNKISPSGRALIEIERNKTTELLRRFMLNE